MSPSETDKEFSLAGSFLKCWKWSKLSQTQTQGPACADGRTTMHKVIRALTQDWAGRQSQGTRAGTRMHVCGCTERYEHKSGFSE